MADLEFFFDPGCPWAWITAKWVRNVQEERPLEVAWKFVALRIVNEDKDYERDFPPGYDHRHTRGLRLLRVAAALRDEVGPHAVLSWYLALGRTIHEEKAADELDDRPGLERELTALGHPAALAAAADDDRWDAVVRAETREALDRCGGHIGTPVLSFAPPDGPSFFGPVISRAPRGKEAVQLWECVSALGANPYFSELKRSTRGTPSFE